MTRSSPSTAFDRFVAQALGGTRAKALQLATGTAAGYRVAVVGRPTFTHDGIPEESIATMLAGAYARVGARLLADLHGTFAIVVASDDGHDTTLAVDRLGIGTLCFGQGGTGLVYGSDASEVAAELRGTSALDASGVGGLDPQGIFDYLFHHCIPGPATVYRGVTRLLAGHVLHMVDGRPVVEPYWAPSYDERRRVAVPELEREFLTTIEDSVRRAIDGAERPGAFLSGGTDSSTVSGMLGAVTGAAARTYSIGFDAEGFDEIGFARIASKRFGTDHHEYYITPGDLVASIPKIAAACDQPFGNSSVLPTYYCAKMAEADGVDRLLGGDGGDELFGGNTRYAKQRVFGLFDHAPAPVRHALRWGLSPSAWAAVPVVRKARSYVDQASARMPDRMHTYNLLTRIGVDQIFEPSFLAEVDPGKPIADMQAWYDRCDAASLLNRMLAFDFKYTLTDNDLPKVVTACGVAGVDVAFPLLDDALVAFAERLDPALKLKGLKLRWFFKHALRDFLPDEIINKSKHGFGLPFGLWMQRDEALNALAFESLESLKQRAIVRSSFIDRLRADLLEDHATYYGELVWVLMMLEQWLQAHAPMRPAPETVSAA